MFLLQGLCSSIPLSRWESIVKCTNFSPVLHGLFHYLGILEITPFLLTKSRIFPMPHHLKLVKQQAALLLCYSSGTRLLQQCYSSGTRLLQQCYSSGTRLLQQCYSSGTRLLQQCYSSGTRLLKQCYSSGTRLLQRQLCLYLTCSSVKANRIS